MTTRSGFAGWMVVSLCISLLLPATTLGELSIASLWKARAFEAGEKLSGLQDKLNQFQREGKDVGFLNCQAMVEDAYGLHLIGEEATHKNEGGMEFFHFVLNDGKAQGLFDLVYAYDSQGEFKYTRVDSLPDGWSLIYLAKSQKMMILRSAEGHCLFALGLLDPFLALAVESR